MNEDYTDLIRLMWNDREPIPTPEMINNFIYEIKEDGKQQERERILKKWSILKEANKCNEKTYYWGDIAMEFNDFIIKEHLRELKKEVEKKC